jgi:hypothetical protein
MRMPPLLLEDYRLDGRSLWSLLDMDKTEFSHKEEVTDELLDRMERRGLPSEALAYRACRDGNDILCGQAVVQASMMLVPHKLFRGLCRFMADRDPENRLLDEARPHLAERAERRSGRKAARSEVERRRKKRASVMTGGGKR